VLLTEHHAMKAYWGRGDIAPRILDEGEWSASRTAALPPDLGTGLDAGIADFWLIY
jgi:hypothetical protein